MEETRRSCSSPPRSSGYEKIKIETWWRDGARGEDQKEKQPPTGRARMTAGRRGLATAGRELEL